MYKKNKFYQCAFLTAAFAAISSFGQTTALAQDNFGAAYGTGASVTGFTWLAREFQHGERLSETGVNLEGAHSRIKRFEMEKAAILERGRELPLANPDATSLIPENQVNKAIRHLHNSPDKKVIKVRVTLSNALGGPYKLWEIEGTPKSIATDLNELKKKHGFYSIGVALKDAKEIAAADARTQQTEAYRSAQWNLDHAKNDAKVYLEKERRGLASRNLERKVFGALLAIGTAAYAGPMVVEKAKAYITDRSLRNKAELSGSSTEQYEPVSGGQASAAK